jgi:large subunit ribosomal protein L5e
MGFVKVVKNKPYFKRFQVKYRRRREGKTDYYARKRLIVQDKNKYNSPKYRLIVRITNKDIICQIAYSAIVGDHILTVAYAHELTRYGLPVGHTNYASAYATGLLLARRHLTKLGLADSYQGNNDASKAGEDYNVEETGERNPFYALLDTGLRRTTTGARIFAALKGACDGGLDVPHSPSRFAGFEVPDPAAAAVSSKDKKKGAAAAAVKAEPSLNTETLRKYIFGGHVASYMKQLKESNPERYKKQFSKFIAAGLSGDNLEATYSKAHAAIRADPTFTKKPAFAGNKKRSNAVKLTLAQRRERIAARKAELGINK